MTSQKLRRRLLVILAADAAGYSRLVAVDDRATVMALEAAREVFNSQVETHAGRIIDTAGDSILAIFESATAGLEAALAIQAQLVAYQGSPLPGTQLQFRIGLHLGDVLEQLDGTVYGDGVNVASRLQALALPGGIVVSKAIRDAARGRVQATFADAGERIVKNIEEAVQTYVVSPRDATSLPGLQDGLGKALANWKSWVGVAVSLSCLLAGGVWLTARHDPGLLLNLGFRGTPSKQADPVPPSSAGPEAGPLSIVVLPFINLTGDPAQEYVADGLTVSITGDLSRIREAFVVSVATARAVKGKVSTAKEIGRELGVHYVLQGTVQRNGTHLRVAAQLADSSSDAQLWSETFEGDSSDLFALQDQVTTRISTSMGRELVVRAAREAERHHGSATVAELLLRARGITLRRWTLSNFQEVEALYRQVLELEPDNVWALSGLASALLLQIPWFEHSASAGASRLSEARALATRSRTLDPGNPLTYDALAYVAAEVGDWNEAVKHAKAGVTLDPKSQTAFNTLGYCHFWNAEPQAALAALRQGLSLDPKFPIEATLYNLAKVELMLHHYESAIDWSLKAAVRSPDLGFRDPTLVVAYKLNGDNAKALSSAAAAIKSDSGFTVSYVLEDVRVTRLSDYYRKVIAPAMRWSGFPE